MKIICIFFIGIDALLSTRTRTFHSHFFLSSTSARRLIARRIYRIGLYVVSLVIPAVVTVIVATSAGYEDVEYPSIEAERLARYAPSVLDSTRVNFALTFSPSCALRITRGEARKKYRGCSVDIHAWTHISSAKCIFSRDYIFPATFNISWQLLILLANQIVYQVYLCVFLVVISHCSAENISETFRNIKNNYWKFFHYAKHEKFFSFIFLLKRYSRITDI